MAVAAVVAGARVVLGVKALAVHIAAQIKILKKVLIRFDLVRIFVIFFYGR